MSRNTGNRYIYPYQIHPNHGKLRKYYYYNFLDGQLPIAYANAATGVTTLAAVPTTINTTNRIIFPGSQFSWDMYSTTAQSILPTAMTVGSGMDIAGDLVDNETVELVPGGITTANPSTNPLAFKLGTDSDFFIKAKFKLTDASGSDQFGIGFRKNGAGQVPTGFLAATDGVYDDFVLFGFAGTKANPNQVRIAFDTNNGGTSGITATNFFWADGVVHTLEVRLVGTRPIFLINGVRIGNTISKDGNGAAITAQTTLSGPAVNFVNTAASTLGTAGSWLLPWIFLRQDADVSEAHFLQEIEIGHLVDVGLDFNAEQSTVGLF